MKVFWIIGLVSVSADWRVSETPLSNSSPIHSARPRWNCAAQCSGAIWDQWSIDDFATRVNIHLSSLKKGQAWARHMSSWKWRHSSHIVMTLTSSCHLPLPVLQWPLCSVLWFCMFIFCVVGMRTEITNSNNMAQVVMEHSVLKGGGGQKNVFFLENKRFVLVNWVKLLNVQPWGPRFSDGEQDYGQKTAPPIHLVRI